MASVKRELVGPLLGNRPHATAIPIAMHIAETVKVIASGSIMADVVGALVDVQLPVQDETRRHHD